MSLATLRKNVCTNIDIGTALKEIAANPHIGDELAFDLLDGRHIECAVTDINDNAIRFDSVDCLGDDMTYGKVEKWLDRIDHLLPDELQRAIIDTERKHVINGKKMDRLERLFLPAASELFSGDNVLGDKGLYKQIDWYKDRRHRMRMQMAASTTSSLYAMPPLQNQTWLSAMIAPQRSALGITRIRILSAMMHVATAMVCCPLP